MSNKHGNLANTTFSTSEFILTGTESVLGRSFVFFNTQGQPLACCNIVRGLTSQPYPPSPARTLSSASTCTVNTHVSGTVSIQQNLFAAADSVANGFTYIPHVYGSMISVNVTHNYTQPLAYRITEFPLLDSGDQLDCSVEKIGEVYVPEDGTGYGDSDAPDYRLGELSIKHGALSSGVADEYRDNGVNLGGPYGIIGRSIVFESNEDDEGFKRVSCCNIGTRTDPLPEVVGPTEDVEAMCEFQDYLDLKGYIHFREPGAGGFGSTITTHIEYYSPSDIDKEHNWEIMTAAYVGAGEPTVRFDPPNTQLGPDDLEFTAGNLGAKHGFLPGNAQNTGSPLTFVDGNVVLTGVDGVLGRSIRLSLPRSSTVLYAYCNIVRTSPGSFTAPATANASFTTPPFVAEAIFDEGRESSGPSIGSVRFVQSFVGSPLEVQLDQLDLSSLGLTAINWDLVISEFGVALQTCETVGGLLSSDQLYSSLKSRNALDSTNLPASYVDKALQFTGSLSILGRSLTVLNATGDAIACASIRLSQGSPPQVRYAYSGVQARCTFNDPGLEGNVQFRQVSPASTDSESSDALNLGTEITSWITVSPSLFIGQFDPKLEISEDASTGGDCKSTGSVFTPDDHLTFDGIPTGALSTRHQVWDEATVKVSNLVDNSLSLQGPNSILGRAVAIKNGDFFVACCNIQNPNSGGPSRSAIPDQFAACYIDADSVKGVFHIAQVTDSSSGELNVTVSTNDLGFWFDNAEASDEFPFEIHSTAPTTGNTGGLLAPFDGIGSSRSGQESPMGALSSKFSRPLKFGTPLTLIDNQLRLAGPYSLLGRSFVVKSSDGTALASCVVRAVSEDYFPPNPLEIQDSVPQCSLGATFLNFDCVEGLWVAPSISYTDDEIVSWPTGNYSVTGGIFLSNGAVLNTGRIILNTPSLSISTTATFNTNMVVGSKIGNIVNNGGTLDVEDSVFRVDKDWLEPPCQAPDPDAPTPTPLPPAPSPTPAVEPQYEPMSPTTVMNLNTNIIVDEEWQPCGVLVVNDADTPEFVPVSFIRRVSAYETVRVTESKNCFDYVGHQNYDETSLTVRVASENACLGLALPIIIAITVSAIVGFLVLMVILILFTPVGITCRIWYRKNCGKDGFGGDSESGF
eukprot:TRINITY_DN2852_c2_g1_i1.p1 TRINITY_DN2852_c2_g1~~TRINITY_DN2852_c2_g1_i1.p1  ORF type:complete len:1243 (+),score=229.19 TRINITY_DN2852_c2_g1_i1:319-3729(+)